MLGCLGHSSGGWNGSKLVLHPPPHRWSSTFNSSPRTDGSSKKGKCGWAEHRCRQEPAGGGADMHSRLKFRIDRVEKAIAKVLKPAVVGESPALLLASRLAAMGFERGPNESLAETTARAMGISPRELRAEFQRRAAGYT